MIWIICPKFWPVVACEALARASCVANKSTQTTCTDLSTQYVLLWPPFYRDKLSAIIPSKVSPFERVRCPHDRAKKCAIGLLPFF